MCATSKHKLMPCAATSIVFGSLLHLLRPIQWTHARIVRPITGALGGDVTDSDPLIQALLRLQSESPELDGSGGVHLHPDGYVMFLDSDGVPSVFMNADDYLALREELEAK